MGARWIYMLPALFLSVLAIILALFGLSREPAPAPTPTPDSQPAGLVMQVTEEQAEQALKHSYWVATRELSIGSTVEDGDFRQVSVSVPLAEAVPADEAVTGELLRRNVRQGEILAKAHLQAINELAQVVPGGYRAFAISISDVSAVGALLKPGDLVDVLAHFKQGPTDRQPHALFLLNSIEVLAVYGQMKDVPVDDEQQRRSRNTTAVLAIPREDLPRLLLADQNGDLRLALAGEARKRGKEGEDENKESKQASADGALKLDDLFPKSQARTQAAPQPRGSRVDVFEGSKSRSTYVH